MNHAKTLVSIALTALIATGCANSGDTASNSKATETDYQTSLAAAKTSLSAAKKSNNIWRDSGKILKKAEAAAKAGDFDMANKLALKAKRQGELAVAQAANQEGAGPM